MLLYNSLILLNPLILTTMAEKTRYSDEELAEFKEIILAKIAQAKKEYDDLRASMYNTNSNDVTDTTPTFKTVEDSASTSVTEEEGRMAQRLLQFIEHLQSALIRIENKTYGICRATGKLIPKERLRAVPHATLSIEGKKMLNQQK